MNSTWGTDSKRNSDIRYARPWTQGYTDVNFKTLETEGMSPALLLRQHWPPTALHLSNCWAESGLGCFSEKWCFSHSLPSSAPWWKPAPKQSPVVTTYTPLDVEGSLTGASLQMGEGRESISRKEHKNQIKWKVQLLYTREMYWFLKVTEITSGCNALFLMLLVHDI